MIESSCHVVAVFHKGLARHLLPRQCVCVSEEKEHGMNERASNDLRDGTYAASSIEANGRSIDMACKQENAGKALH